MSSSSGRTWLFCAQSGNISILIYWTKKNYSPSSFLVLQLLQGKPIRPPQCLSICLVFNARNHNLMAITRAERLAASNQRLTTFIILKTQLKVYLHLLCATSFFLLITWQNLPIPWKPQKLKKPIAIISSLNSFLSTQEISLKKEKEKSPPIIYSFVVSRELYQAFQGTSWDW